jgi:hypothetical protein
MLVLKELAGSCAACSPRGTNEIDDEEEGCPGVACSWLTCTRFAGEGGGIPACVITVTFVDPAQRLFCRHGIHAWRLS